MLYQSHFITRSAGCAPKTERVSSQPPIKWRNSLARLAALGLIITGIATVPMSALAATISGIKYIDSTINGTKGVVDSGDEPLGNETIYLKSESSPSFVRPTSTTTGDSEPSKGRYTFSGLLPGTTYRVWQKSNPTATSSATAYLSYETALRVTISSDGQLSLNGNQVLSVDFPIQGLTALDRDFVNNTADDMQQRCTGAVLISEFGNASTSDVVKINSSLTLASPLKVRGLCNYGELNLTGSAEVDATEFIANYGSIVGQNGTRSSDNLPNFPVVNGNPAQADAANKGGNGTDIILLAGAGEDGTCIEGSEAVFYNNGTIQSGRGGSGYLVGGSGGMVYIDCSKTIVQDGIISSGTGGEANAHQPEWDTMGQWGNLSVWRGDPVLLLADFRNNTRLYANIGVAAGIGGEVLISTGSSSNQRFIATPLSQMSSGEGGQAGAWCTQNPNQGGWHQDENGQWVQWGIICNLENWNNDDPRWPTGDCRCRDAQGNSIIPAPATPGNGGDLTIYSSGNLTLQGQAISGASVYFEPEMMIGGKDFKVTAKEDIFIFGGDNWELNLNDLSENAITAGRNIVLAVGPGGKINLTGNAANIFKAAGKIEIYADNVVLDSGVTLENLVSEVDGKKPEIVKAGNKIIYHATLSGMSQVTDKASATVPVSLALHNVGPKVDTYTLSVISQNGWTVNGLPTTATVDGLKQTDLNFNVTLPAEGNDVITVTATSQADSTVVATTQVQASVEKPVVVEPEKVALTVSKVGEGTVTAEGIACGDDCTEDYAINTEVKLTATPVEGYELGSWSGDCATDTVTMDAAKNCTATFDKKVVVIDPPVEIGKYTAHGTLKDKAGNVLAGVTVQIGDKTVVTDGAGNWEIGGLVEGTYDVVALKEGFACLTSDVELGNQQYLQAVNCEPVTSLKAKLTNKQWGAIPQGENLSYTVTLFNGGTVAATNIALTGKFPEGVTVAKFEGDNAVCESGTCTLTELAPGASATLTLELSNLPATGKNFMNSVTVTSTEYPADEVKSWRKVKPYLSLLGKSVPNPVEMGKALHYQLAAELLNTAPETTAKDVKAEIRLPNEVKFVQATASQGTCENVGNTVTCNLGDLSVETSDSISRVDIQIDAELGQDLVQLNAETKVTASNYPEHTEVIATNTVLGDGKVDGILLLDVTASMGDELQAVIKAVKDKLNQLNQQFENAAKPVIALVSFRDSVKIEVISDDLNTLLEALKKLEAKDGGLCPEASAEALDLALDHIKPNGLILFVTDAPPYDNTDIEALKAKIVAKQANFVPIVTTSDCATNQLSSPQQ